MDVFEVDPDTAVTFNEMSIEDLVDFVNLHNSPEFYKSAKNDSDIELCIYACFLIFTRTASIQILERAILSADLWMAATPRDHPHWERRIEILDTMLARKLQTQTEQVQGELKSRPALDSIGTARLIQRPDHNPFPPHTMLCGTCIHMLSQTLPMSDFSVAFQTSFDQIYLSGVLRYCIICSIFAEAVKNPGSDLHVIHKDWMSSIKENREPKELILAFAVDVSGISGGGGPLELTLRNRLRILWQFAGENSSGLRSNDDLTFLLSPLNLNQPPDDSMKCFLVGDTEQKFLRTGRTEKSQYCPFCEPSNKSDSSRPKIDLSVKGIDTEDKPNGAFVVDYYRHRISPSNNTGDDTSWSKALEWLDECSTNHTKCRERQEDIRKEWHPTRLLDLCPTRSHDNLRLILRADDRPSGEYMTLSHCWGKASFLNLTTDNLESFRQGISLHDLPKTFQDAVEVTRKLGIRYLWIDSLCIIQSGNRAEADWQYESSTMGKVYFHSFLNIGATGAADGTMGCFRERDYAKVRRPVLAKPDCKTHEQYYQPYHLVEKQFLERNLLTQPLLQRGWVFQERFLTPRMLHFGSEQLFWECDEMTACETYPAHLTISDPVRLHILDHGKNKSATDGLSSDMHLRHRLSSWYEIVDEYSTKQLTKSCDKLIALSGIAQRYAEFWAQEDDRYLAGLWRSDVSDGLLWKTDGTATRVKEWRAPSWSWASLDGNVQRGLRSGGASAGAFEGKQLCEIHEAQIELANKEYPFGALESAVLPIQGKIVPAIATRGGDGYFLAHEGSTIPRSTWFPDETLDRMPQTTINVLCLVVKKELSFDRERTLMGLTVKLHGPGSTGEYVRTGCFVITADTRRELCPDTPFHGFLFEDVKLTEKDLIKLL